MICFMVEFWGNFVRVLVFRKEVEIFYWMWFLFDMFGIKWYLCWEIFLINIFFKKLFGVMLFDFIKLNWDFYFIVLRGIVKFIEMFKFL